MRYVVIILILTSCSYKFPTPHRGAVPTSTLPGAASNVTSLRFNDFDAKSFEVYEFDGFLESKTIGYKLPKDTVASGFFLRELSEKPPIDYRQGDLHPGAVWVSKDKFFDEVEITNLNWAEFLYYIKRDSSESLFHRMNPDSKQLPREDYFSNPFFRFYPVVGITYEQAQTYCKWRSAVVNNVNKKHSSSKFSLEFRLPSESEWEKYAACGVDPKRYPYGVKYVECPVKVNTKAARYLKEKNRLTQSVQEITRDINAFNKSKTSLILYNVDRINAPYFLANTTPFYVFDLPINNYGIYNMIGNVAELVAEKGITKGGSYKDRLEDCKITSRGNYTGASPTVGFRAICDVKFE